VDEPVDGQTPTESERTEPSNACRSCDGSPRWESVVDGWGERWLATCTCGRVDTFFPDRRHPEQQPSDPLTLFLQGHLRARRPATPAWVRLYLTSVQEPWSVRWRHDSTGCALCDSNTTFGLLAWPRPFTAAVCTVCLNCGYTTASYSNPSAGTEEATLDGTAWAPACPAVKRLRECIFVTVESARWSNQRFES
jgi:hypothetical protein